MIIETAYEKMSFDIGYDIGHSDDIVQSNLLNGLFKPFKDNHFDCNTQMAYISKNLEDNTKQMIITLSEYCK